jgi:hypothetical protein
MGSIARTSVTQRPRVRNRLIQIEQLHGLNLLNVGFSQDIEVTPDDLNLAVSLFFVTFRLFQYPSAAMGR